LKKRRILTALFLAFLAVAPATHRASAQSAPQKNFAEIKAKAEQGDPIAQNSLGSVYENGLLGVTKNKAEAIKWYTKAADQGSGSAQNNLCSQHSEALGVLKGIRPPAGQELGPIEPLHGAKEEADEIINWCHKGANKGYSDSKRNLGVFYGKGTQAPDGTELVKQDFEESYFWLSMGYKSPFRDAVAKNLTPEKRTEIEKKAKDWKPPPNSTPPATPSVAPPATPPAPPGITPPSP
jgi:TPR repeat protein